MTPARNATTSTTACISILRNTGRRLPIPLPRRGQGSRTRCQIPNKLGLGWPVAVDVLNRRLVPPSDLVPGQAENRSHAITLGRAWRPAAQDNRQNALLIQARFLRELAVVNLPLDAQFFDTAKRFHRG